jgi:hypothetical protein
LNAITRLLGAFGSLARSALLLLSLSACAAFSFPSVEAVGLQAAVFCWPAQLA